MGGVDLSTVTAYGFHDFTVPARVGGVDLSFLDPHNPRIEVVPARVGGVDLSGFTSGFQRISLVPARVGGVDLSHRLLLPYRLCPCPRPCGRGGFKLDKLFRSRYRCVSPPVWAGWI